VGYLETPVEILAQVAWAGGSSTSDRDETTGRVGEPAVSRELLRCEPSGRGVAPNTREKIPCGEVSWQ
jgi:hypothetical protein